MKNGKDMLTELVSIINEQHRDCEIVSGLVVSKFKNGPCVRAVMFRTDTGKYTLGDFHPDQMPEFRTWIEKMT